GGRAAAASWAGAGPFGKLIADLADDRLQVDTGRSSNVLYDPTRHVLTQHARDRARPAGVPEVAERVNRVVGAPLLTPSGYRTLFDCLVSHRRASPRPPRPARPRAPPNRPRPHPPPAPAAPAPPPPIPSLLPASPHSGVTWPAPALAPPQLAASFADNVLRLTADAQMDLSDSEEHE